jgi:hypothetical protein
MHVSQDEKCLQIGNQSFFGRMGGFLNDIYEKVNNTSLLGLDMVTEEKEIIFNEKGNIIS